MKARFGYVSNSSSSSFCVVGVQVYDDDADFSRESIDAMRQSLVDLGFGRDEVDAMPLYEVFEKIYGNLGGKEFRERFGGLVFKNGIEEYSGVIVGRSIKAMQDNETLAQFKKGTYDQLRAIGFLGSERDVEICIDGGSV